MISFIVGPRDNLCFSGSDSFCRDEVAWESQFSFIGKMKFLAIIVTEKSLGDSSEDTQAWNVACQAIYIKSPWNKINMDFSVLFYHLAEKLQA